MLQPVTRRGSALGRLADAYMNRVVHPAGRVAGRLPVEVVADLATNGLAYTLVVLPLRAMTFRHCGGVDVNEARSEENPAHE